MDEALFWQLIEASWTDSPEDNEDRIDALETNDEDELLELADTMSDVIMHNYRRRLGELDKPSMAAFLRILEVKMYELDRKEIHDHLDGSDDGFVYARGFVIFMGEEYFNKINEDPSQGTFDTRCEEFVFEGYSIYEEKFEEPFERYQVCSVETGSNKEGWPKEL
ncbi:hypothetical protein DCC81_07100 [Chitinophaga parva]|uniref:DUF4240 domain-containing protein n=1 Tax=Chitinophaga parva TaxID=2169414 RepID=A0A2T7BNH5_9BACT|nr:DUF4240 domain-containing protein [Chitinophaga parva]PUZ29224.1 hypothetical protein DCC81_07100 [Chitinophaga parva]